MGRWGRNRRAASDVEPSRTSIPAAPRPASSQRKVAGEADAPLRAAGRVTAWATGAWTTMRTGVLDGAGPSLLRIACAEDGTATTAAVAAMAMQRLEEIMVTPVSEMRRWTG
jgi:hypothetical protein